MASKWLPGIGGVIGGGGGTTGFVAIVPAVVFSIAEIVLVETLTVIAFELVTHAVRRGRLGVRKPANLREQAFYVTPHARNRCGQYTDMRLAILTTMIQHNCNRLLLQ